MNKKIIYTFLLMGIFAQLNSLHKDEKNFNSIIQQEFGFSGDELVNLVARRYYFVQRLSFSYATLHNLSHHMWQKLSSEMQQAVIQLPENSEFKTLAVRLAVAHIKESKSLQPLFILWDELIHYKLLNDEQFLKEFVHILYIISHNALVSILPIRHKDLVLPEINNHLTPEQEVEFIDFCWESITDKKPINDTILILSFINAIPPITVNEVMARFYQIKRTTDAYGIVEREYKKLGECLITYHEFNNQLVLNGQVVFTEPAVIECIKIMVRTKDYSSFIKLCHDTVTYKYLHNTVFMREILILFYVVFEQITQKMVKKTKSKVVNSQTISLGHEMYSQLHNLSVEEILDAIDILTLEVSPFLEQYEINSDMTWKAWLKKYWWLPPTVISVVTLRLYLKTLDARYFGGTKDKDEEEKQPRYYEDSRPRNRGTYSKPPLRRHKNYSVPY